MAFTVVLALALLPSASAQKSAEVLFESARQKQMLEGDLKGAIRLYEQIVKQYAGDRAVVARAMLQMAECHEKLGQAEARRIYEQITQRYGDQAAIAAQARQRLAVMNGGVKTPATLTARQVLTGGASVIDPECSITPDGRLMAMTHWDSGDLAVRDLVTGEVKRLNQKTSWRDSSDFAEAPLFSPDKRTIVYSWFNDKEWNYEFRLVSTEVGAKPRILIRNKDLAWFNPVGWSADGKSILVMISLSNRASQLAWVSAADGAVKVLRSMAWRSPSHLALSPDGRYVAYDILQSEDGSARDIELLATDGGTHSVVVQGPTHDASPAWSPDGSRLFFVSNRSGRMDLFSLAINDGKAQGTPQLAKADVGNIIPKGFTRSGLFFYVHSRADNDVFIIDMDPATGKARGTPARLADGYIGLNQAPAWSPDGKWISYLSRRGPTFGQTSASLVVRSVETGLEKVFQNANRMGGFPVWFHRSFAILRTVADREGRVSFHRLDAATGRTELLFNTGTRFNRAVLLAPDDASIYAAVIDETTRRDAVVRYDLSTGQRITLHSGPGAGTALGLSLSPDGQSLALTGWTTADEKRLPQVAVMSVDGSGFRVLVAGSEGESFPPNGGRAAWSPDGRNIYFLRKKSGPDTEVWRVPATGGTAEFTGLVAKGLRLMDLSPDGSRLAFTAGEQLGPSTELWVLENVLPVAKASR